MVCHLLKLLIGSVAVVATSCVGSDVTRCTDGTTCPQGRVCDLSHGLCVRPSQLSACKNIPDGESCDFEAASDGSCHQGVCFGVECGNRILNAGEICDDGNTNSGDGCSANCQSKETCGNGILDVDEGCDCGDGTAVLPPQCQAPNGSSKAALCRTNCTLHSCGDGVLSGVEDCEKNGPILASCSDFGFYKGELGCSPFCRFDVSACFGFCGDDLLNGQETCDGHPPTSLTCLDFGFERGTLGCTDRCGVDQQNCKHIGLHPLGQGAAGVVTDIWAFSATDIYIATSQGIDHYDGSTWTQSRTEGAFNALWGLPSGELVAVGADGAVLVKRGPAWRTIATDFGTDIQSVWGTNSTNLYVADRHGTVRHLAGATWRELPVQGHQVWGLGATDVYVVAKENIWHGAVDTWTALNGPKDVMGIWGVAPNQLFVATNPTTNTQGRVHTYNGATWNEIFPLSGPARRITGSNKTVAIATNSNIQYWDGQQFVTIFDDGTLSPKALSFTKDNALVAAHDLGHVTIVHDAFWHRRLLLGGNALWAIRDKIYVAGARGTVTTFPSNRRQDINTNSHVLALAGDQEQIRFAVGTDGLLAHRTDTGWSVVSPPPTTTDIIDVWEIEPTHALALSADSHLLQYNGNQWRKHPNRFARPLTALWAANHAEIWAVGHQGSIVRWSDQEWTPVATTTTNTLHAIWGTDDARAFAVGAAGTIYHYDGEHWQEAISPTGSTLRSVWGTSATNVYAAGDNVLLHFDGTHWTLIRPPQQDLLFRSITTIANRVAVIDSHGSIWFLDHLPL